MKTVEISVKGKCATHYISSELTQTLSRMERYLLVRKTKRELLEDGKTMYAILEKMNYTTFLYFVLESDFQHLSKKYNIPITDKLKFRILVLQNNFYNFSKVAKMLNISQVQVSRIEKKILNKMKIELIS